MSYQKLLVDNTVCSRRFHLTFDDESKTVPHVEIRCPHCKHILFEADDHPPVTFARDENLLKSTSLSRNIIRECDFKDTFKGQ